MTTLPRLTDEELINVRKATRTISLAAWADTRAFGNAVIEAQRLKDEQWMREQKPVAWIDRRELEVMGKDPLVEPTVSRDSVGESDVELYAAPVPASQGDGELRRLILSAEAHRKDRDWELMILDLREAAALAAPVTTKENGE